MKNIKRLLVAAAAVLSASGMATFAQPMVPVSEDAPFRISGGVTAGALFQEFGVNNLGAALGFTHNVGYDFEYGISFTPGYANGYEGRLFGKEKEGGFRLDGELMVRFMPEIADNFHLGGFLGAGVARQITGQSDAAKEAAKNVAFGDIAFRVGPAFSYCFTDGIALYGSVAFAGSQFRIFKDTASDDFKKKQSNFLGAEGTLGMFFSVADNTALFVDATPKFTDVMNFTKSYRQEVSLGVSFAI